MQHRRLFSEIGWGKKSAEYVGAQILIHDNTYSFYEYFPLNYGQSQ